MSWIQTYTGRRFQLQQPSPEDVDIVDIAHALSQLCRFGGHCKTFYSVAQHCVEVCRRVDLTDMKWGLLHDAAEAYVGDVVGPLKRELAEYKAAEHAVLAAIAARFQLQLPIPKAVVLADRRMLITEKQQLFDREPYAADLVPLPPLEAEKLFLSCWSLVDAI